MAGFDDWEESDRDDERAAELNFSRRLDVHTWSEYPEVNQFVDRIYEAHFAGGNERIQKRHLKVVLLDLFVAWHEDPKLKISVSLNRNDYKSKSIYNELHISARTIDVVYRLNDEKLIEIAKGFFDRERGKGRLTRIWPTEVLLEEFRHAKFGILDICYSPSRLPIVLRDHDGKDVDFDIGSVEHEISLLNAYNELLTRTFISIPDLDTDAVRLNGGEFLIASQARKFVHRVYNNSSFQLGGRFYGGWWQNCPKQLRDKILIDDKPTIEVDFSSIHPTLLYAKEGIDYWRDVGKDPYAIGAVSFQKDPNELRQLGKDLLLILLNANERSVVPSALRSKGSVGSWIRSLQDAQVEEAIAALEAMHPSIAKYFHTGAALMLMNEDSAISEQILRRFLDMDTPVLLIHDSYIVEESMGEILELTMQAAFATVTGTNFASKLKFVGQTYDEVMQELGARYAARQGQGTAEEEAEDLALYRTVHPIRSERYLRELEEFRAWSQDRTVSVFESERFVAEVANDRKRSRSKSRRRGMSKKRRRDRKVTD